MAAEQRKANTVGQKPYSLNLDNDEITEIDNGVVVSSDDYQFTTDGELAIHQYQDDNPQGARAVDIIDKFVIGNDSQVFEAVDSNTYVAAIDDSSHGEQFLTMPRGSTQITVCDNGNIVYTDDCILDSTLAQTKVKDENSSHTIYYQTEDLGVPNQQQMEVENEVHTEYIQQIVNSNQLDGAAFITSENSKGGVNDLVLEEEATRDIQARAVAETVLNSADMKKFIALQQDSSRGMKRTLPISPSKSVTKLFIQGTPVSTAQQPITIVGSLPGNLLDSRAITLAQAQRMGLLSPTKIHKVGNIPSRMIVKKVTSGSSVLAPTKILPAPASKVRTQVIGGRNSTPGSLMPVRTNIPVSQLKMLTAISSPTTQVKPVAVTKGVLTGDSRSPHKVYVRPAATVLSPIAGQLSRIGTNATFQPIQIKGKPPSVQYVKIIGSGSSSGSFSQPKLIKTVSGRTIPIAPSPVSSKSIGSATGIIVPVSASEGGKMIKLTAPNMMTIGMKGKAYTTIRSSVPFVEDNEIELLEEDKMESGDDIEELCDKENVEGGHPESVLEANGIRPKKPCNCTKSQCLKLYCECFANGEFCFQCNCNNCFNNIEHEEERQLSIQSCLDRNPLAFRPKFQIRESEEEDHRNKGCNCKRSGCFKNYCECFEAKIACSKVCKCQGCKNTEEEWEANRKMDSDEEGVENGAKPHKFMSASLGEALCQCMLAQAEKAESNDENVETIERRIIEEFGQCIVQIIGNRNKRETR